MSSQHPFIARYELPAKLTEIILLAAFEMGRQSVKAFRTATRPDGGRTLRPGAQTPLWNELRKQIRPYLRRHGDQARLARLLGLPRQRVNAFATGGGQMPDAERTLELLAWLMAVRNQRPPA